MSETPRRPLNHATPTEVYIRVARAMIERDYRARPKAYAPFPAAEIERLAELQRASGCSAMVPWLKAAARHVASGVPLRVWASSLPWDWNRAVFKQAWRKR